MTLSLSLSSVLALSLRLASGLSASRDSGLARWVSAGPGDLQVTNGRLDRISDAGGAAWAVRTPSVRAVYKQGSGEAVALTFVYRGPTAEAAPFASGEVRRQIGLKLLAQDTCNVLYVMWHLSPSTGLHVSLKSNPQKSTQAACGDGGYVNLAAKEPPAELAPIREGEPRSLRAVIDSAQLRVWVDGQLAWRGVLPAVAAAAPASVPASASLPAFVLPQGPAGMRADNASFDFALWRPAARLPERTK